MTIEEYINKHFDYTDYNITVDTLCDINEMFKSGMDIKDVKNQMSVPAKVVHCVRNSKHLISSSNEYIVFVDDMPVVSIYKKKL